MLPLSITARTPAIVRTHPGEPVRVLRFGQARCCRRRRAGNGASYVMGVLLYVLDVALGPLRWEPAGRCCIRFWLSPAHRLLRHRAFIEPGCSSRRRSRDCARTGTRSDGRLPSTHRSSLARPLTGVRVASCTRTIKSLRRQRCESLVRARCEPFLNEDALARPQQDRLHLALLVIAARARHALDRIVAGEPTMIRIHAPKPWRFPPLSWRAEGEARRGAD